jgi:hypothetical protein
MTNVRVRVRSATVAVGILSFCTASAPAEPPDDPATLTVRLVHPDQQAAEVVRIFEGAAAPHPAAALAAWKRSTRNPAILGKPLDALIAAFNPEMAREWRVLDQAELRVDLNQADGRPRWHALVPHDDGTIAAAITALRLTDGAGEPPLEVDTASDGTKRLAIQNPKSKIQNLEVERLGPPGATLSTRAGDILILGSSRDELLRGLRTIFPHESGGLLPVPTEMPGGLPASGRDRSRNPGVIFELDPGRLAAAGTGPLALVRTGELLRGLTCRRLHGHVAFEGDCAALWITTSLDTAKLFQSIAEKPAAVDPAWLKWVPSTGVMAVVSIALEPGAGFWDWTFALADRLDRADPARSKLAPLRTRANLLAAAARVRPEADLWPHLKGVTACLLADAKQPGRPAGGLLVLHVDSEDAANQLASELVPRLATRFVGKTPVKLPAPSPPDRQAVAAPGDAGPGDFVRLGSVSGRSLSVGHRGRDVLVAWGDEVPLAVRAAVADPRCSAATICTGWDRSGMQAPQRLGAFWPARAGQRPAAGLTASAWDALAEDPPVLWWGWNNRGVAADSIRWPGLKVRAHRFLKALPLDPSPIPSQP